MIIRGRTVVGVLVFLGFILWGIGLGGGPYFLFVDAPSFLFVIGCIAGGTLARHPLNEIASLGDDVADTLITSSVGSGTIGVLVGFIQMLHNMSDPSAIGPAMAIALLTSLYGIGLALIFYFLKSGVKTNRIVIASLLSVPVILLGFFSMISFISK